MKITLDDGIQEKELNIDDFKLPSLYDYSMIGSAYNSDKTYYTMQLTPMFPEDPAALKNMHNNNLVVFRTDFAEEKINDILNRFKINVNFPIDVTFSFCEDVPLLIPQRVYNITIDLYNPDPSSKASYRKHIKDPLSIILAFIVPIKNNIPVLISGVSSTFTGMEIGFIKQIITTKTDESLTTCTITIKSLLKIKEEI